MQVLFLGLHRIRLCGRVLQVSALLSSHCTCHQGTFGWITIDHVLPVETARLGLGLGR